MENVMPIHDQAHATSTINATSQCIKMVSDSKLWNGIITKLENATNMLNRNLNSELNRNLDTCNKFKNTRAFIA